MGFIIQNAISVLPDKNEPDAWRVERSIYGGEIEVTIFYGNDTRDRANTYADWIAGK